MAVVLEVIELAVISLLKWPFDLRWLCSISSLNVVLSCLSIAGTLKLVECNLATLQKQNQGLQRV